MDGDAALPRDAVCFEAKRYSESPKRETVLTKIADLARSRGDADRLWVLGATVEVNAQLSSEVTQDGDRNAISTFVLDWVSSPLPQLAIAIVSAGDEAINFLVDNFDPATGQEILTREALVDAFSSVSEHPDFEVTCEKVKESLNVSKLAFAKAIEQNLKWRNEVFCSARKARITLGQAIAVLEDRQLPGLRQELRQKISDKLKVCQELTLLGDEGHGKSWLAAQMCSSTPGMGVFLSSENFEGVSADNLEEFLINMLIKQSGDISDTALRLRWSHRLKAWQASPPLAQLLVIVDGINQRQSLPWGRILNALHCKLQEIGARLVVTVRPQFWHRTVLPGLDFNPSEVQVPEWSPQERDALLTHHGIVQDWLDDATRKTLCNPRLLGVAIQTLPRREPNAWKGLTTDRILMEHLRSSQRENFEAEPFAELTRRLSQHAVEVVERVTASRKALPQHFQADANAVIETRFFRSIEGPGDLYELRNEGLTLALGFALVDQLWRANIEGHSLSERVVQLIEPINAIDRTADVVFAALLVCALDDTFRFHRDIFAASLDAFANLQNIPDQRFEEFVEIVKHQPTAFLEVVERLLLERGQRINHDWFYHATFEVASSEVGRSAAESAIRRWLHCYNKSPETQTSRYHPRQEAEYEKSLKEKRDHIEQTLASFSPFEKQLLSRMIEVAGEPDRLITLALELLASRSLAAFSDCFVAMGMAFALDSGLYSCRKAFQQLTTFNRVERSAARHAFHKALEPLRSRETSRGGQWTVVRMLYATGNEADAAEAQDISLPLKREWALFEAPDPKRWRQVKAADPLAQLPSDFEIEIDHFKALNPAKMLDTLWSGGEYNDYEEFLPMACRFAPAEAYAKARSIMAGLLEREGFPLRQLILNSEDRIPLVQWDLARAFVKRIVETDVIETIPEQDRQVCRWLAYYTVAARLSAEEQLRCMKGDAFGDTYTLSVIPAMKDQPTENITDALNEVLARNDEKAAFRILSTALYGGTEISPSLEEQILECSIHQSAMLRAMAFQHAVVNNLRVVRDEHVKSLWTSERAENGPYESWYGSALLIEACAYGELSIDELLKRIDHETWFAAAARLGGKFTIPMASCFAHRLRGGVAKAGGIPVPQADLTFSMTDFAPYPFLSVDETERDTERFPKQKSLSDVLGGEDKFEETRDRLHQVAKLFLDSLKESDARLLLQRITIEDLQHLVLTVPSILPDLVAIIERADKSQMVWLKNLAFAIAKLISTDEPDKAASILRRALASPGFVTQALGDDLTLEHAAIWGAARSEPIVSLWRERLFGAANDAILAREVLAAERFGAAGYIRDLVFDLTASVDSLDHAYAATIASFSSQSNEMVEAIQRHVKNVSLSGEAAKAAMSSHQAAQWAEKWIVDMWDARAPEEFWRCLIIAKTCMDARVSTKPRPNTLWAQYAPVFHYVRKAALKERTKEREKKLLGMDAPDAIFITLPV
ncbi:hypothetical protein [Oryzibacter oryziterrae]|uniref:hypothetical protein n=1 Tax=Oryzibacter oryziterrae TaxID=2766474 RepID=UPI001F24A364|nr:hypothetical protein [Oryzibacter oryziterrae]